MHTRFVVSGPESHDAIYYSISGPLESISKSDHRSDIIPILCTFVDGLGLTLVFLDDPRSSARSVDARPGPGLNMDRHVGPLGAFGA